MPDDNETLVALVAAVAELLVTVEYTQSTAALSEPVRDALGKLFQAYAGYRGAQ